MDNQQLAKEGLTLVGQITAHRRVMTSDTAVAQLLCDTPELNAYFIAARQTAGAQEQANLVKLFQKIDQHFNDSELRNLAFRLGVEYENLTGETRRDKARELVTHMQRHVRLSELINQTAALRPQAEWQDKPQQAGGVDIISRLDIAVVVDVARPAFLDVGCYLDDHDQAVNFVLLKPPPPGGNLSPDNSWNNIVHAFAQAMSAIKGSVSGARLHFFLSAPGALLFGLGCIWGTVDEATVYHYERGIYYPVIAVSRELRA